MTASAFTRAIWKLNQAGECVRRQAGREGKMKAESRELKRATISLDSKVNTTTTKADLPIPNFHFQASGSVVITVIRIQIIVKSSSSINSLYSQIQVLSKR